MTHHTHLLQNLHLIHTTPLGLERIRKNLALFDAADVLSYAIGQIQLAETIIRQGKNWYAQTNDAVYTINAHSYTIITAHKIKK